MSYTSSLIKFFLILIMGSPTLFANSRYSSASYDFGLRIGPGLITNVDKHSHPLFDISSDFRLFKDKLRMVFGVSFIYPNANSDLFSVAGLQYVGLEYQFPFLKNRGQIGLKMTKSYIKNAAPQIQQNRSITLYLGYKHPLKNHLDLMIQSGLAKSPFKLATSTNQDLYSLLLRSGFIFYF